MKENPSIIYCEPQKRNPEFPTQIRKDFIARNLLDHEELEFDIGILILSSTIINLLGTIIK